MTDPAASVARFEVLRSARGRELLDRLARGDVDGDNPLRVGERLRAEYPTELVVAALAQHELRQRAAAKFDRAAEMFFTREGLEQASTELVARYRARRYRWFDTVGDLCSGIGGDLLALAGHTACLAVDRDPLHLRIATANTEVHGVADRVTTALADVRDVRLDGVDAVFMDPARRAGDRRMAVGDSEPPLSWCTALTDRVAAVGVKAAPALPRTEVPDGWELELIAVGRELKEATLWSPALRAAARRATILPEGHSLEPTPGGDVPTGSPGAYLLDPNPAVTRAGLVQDLARRLDAWQLDPQIAFLATDAPLHSPFARTLRVVESMPWNLKRLRACLRALDIGAVDIRRRGLAGDVADLRKRLKLAGTRRATVAMTRVDDRPWALVCVDPE